METFLMKFVIVCTGTGRRQRIGTDPEGHQGRHVPQAQVGQTVTATVELDATGTPNCGLRVRWGDGAVTERKINSAAEVPFVTTHTYAKAGRLHDGCRPGPRGWQPGLCRQECQHDREGVRTCTGCSGARCLGISCQTAAALPDLPRWLEAQCQDRWSRRSGAYTCTAKAGTATPDKKPACPGDLTYFENSKKGLLGCRV
jgi:hypothetical protein